MTTVTLQVQLTQINCGVCGGVYAITERYRAHKEKNAGTWHCPYCRNGWGYHETEEDRLRKQLGQKIAENDQLDAELRQKKADLEHAERRRRAEKGQKTRLINRIAKGICPCCNQEFSDLQQHMIELHPEFSAAAETDAEAEAENVTQ
jgi:phage/plasmid primase-like uncharacterized protein